MTPQTCERCGHSFSPAAAPGGMCPRCLLLGGADELPGDDLSVEELRDAVPGFRIEALLGRGGMGAVFRARQLDLDRDVAIKFIAARDHDPSFGERFEREARTMARLNHPNIVTAHRYGRAADGHAYIVMEYVAGGDLAQLIAAGNIPEAVALSLVEQVCGALAYAHEQGCVHRDIKPGNILIDLHGRVKVADFGLAKLFGEHVPASALTLSFVGVGTAHYAAPEQTKPGAPVDHRADIYALGVVLYEMLTGEVPRGAFPNPSAKSGALRRWDGVVVRAMAAQPERRFGSTQELGCELAVIRRELDFRAGVRRFGWKRPALIAAGIVVAAGALVPMLPPADFSISRSGHALLITDRSGRGGALAISEPEPGSIRFSAAERTFRAGYGWRSAGSSAALPLAGVTRIAVEGKGGARTLHVGAFTSPLPSLALHASAVSFDGSIPFAMDAGVECDGGSAEVADGAQLVTSGAGSIAFKTSGRIALRKGASLETQDGDLTLSANASGATVGAFAGIELAGATLTTRGTGKMALSGRGGTGSDAGYGYGIHLHRGAVVRSTFADAGAGAIVLTGAGGGSGSSTRGVSVRGEGTTITSVHGAITITGTAGPGEGDNLTGLDIRDGGRVVSTGTGPNAAPITLIGVGGVHGTGGYNCGIMVATTNGNDVFGASVLSVDGSISLTGTSGVGNAISTGIFIGDGATVAASGAGNLSLIGTSDGRSLRWCGGVQIYREHASGYATRVTTKDGEIIIEGTALPGASTALVVEDPAFVQVTGTGRITLIGDSMDIIGAVDAGAGDVILLPRTAGTALNLGSILGPIAGTLELSNQELSRITAGTLRIGDIRSGPVVTTTPLGPPASLVLTSGGEVKIVTPITMRPGHSFTVTALDVYVTLPGAGLTASGTGAISVTASREISMLRETSITTADGNLTLSANADGSALGNCRGVDVVGGNVRTTGSGALSVSGIHGRGDGSGNFGVSVQGGGSITGGTGGTTVIADGNGARYALAVGTRSAGSITSNSPLTLRADSIALGPDAKISSGTAPLTLTPRTAGTLIHLGGADVPGGSPLTLGLSDAELGCITAGAVQWGDERSGAITITEPISLANRAKLPPAAVEEK